MNNDQIALEILANKTDKYLSKEDPEGLTTFNLGLEIIGRTHGPKLGYETVMPIAYISQKSKNMNPSNSLNSCQNNAFRESPYLIIVDNLDPCIVHLLDDMLKTHPIERAKIYRFATSQGASVAEVLGEVTITEVKLFVTNHSITFAMEIQCVEKMLSNITEEGSYVAGYNVQSQSPTI